ncbi:uncharacterized protein LOC107217565 [Neodiprion lecontei]|uniref:Uncharacterized protein LOC107217565 n=1 Tax=Neodiprion lecontei TaxID=441921 RepID=A0A6J0B6E3_NEOLC|nr:uncharacterized protein LOC107217565 [Neodiprion lecontei]
MDCKTLCDKGTSLHDATKNEFLERVNFRNRKQKEDEPIEDVALAIKILAAKYKFTEAELENNIIDQLINGVKDDLTRYELLKMSSKTSKEFTETAKIVEMATKNSKSKNNSHPENSVSTFNYTRSSNNDDRGNRYQRQDRASTSRRRSTTQQGARACHCCCKNNHLKAQCSLRYKYCSDCGKQGHIFKMCPKKSNQTGRVNNIQNEQSKIENLTENLGTNCKRLTSTISTTRIALYQTCT